MLGLRVGGSKSTTCGGAVFLGFGTCGLFSKLWPFLAKNYGTFRGHLVFRGPQTLNPSGNYPVVPRFEASECTDNGPRDTLPPRMFILEILHDLSILT